MLCAQFKIVLKQSIVQWTVTASGTKLNDNDMYLFDSLRIFKVVALYLFCVNASYGQSQTVPSATLQAAQAEQSVVHPDIGPEEAIFSAYLRYQEALRNSTFDADVPLTSFFSRAVLEQWLNLVTITGNPSDVELAHDVRAINRRMRFLDDVHVEREILRIEDSRKVTLVLTCRPREGETSRTIQIEYEMFRKSNDDEWLISAVRFESQWD